MIKKQTLILVIPYLVFLLIFNSLYAIEVAGEVSGTWTINDSPVSVLDTIFIPEDDTLLIEPGVIVNFTGPYSLLVYGDLMANGTDDDSIVFHPDEDVEFWCGIRADSGATVALEYCIISNCCVGDADNRISGSALYCEESESISVIRSTFSENRCFYQGGAIYTNWCHPVTIEMNMFTGNIAGLSGALAIIHSDEITIIENTFIGNNALGSGGAIGTRESPSEEFIISGNTFSENVAGSMGGAIYLGHLTLAEMSNNVFSRNHAENEGGAIYFDHSSRPYHFHSNTIVFNESEIGGGISVVANDWSVISNCIFWGNHADEGAQVHFYEHVDEVFLSYCTIEGEWPEEYSDHLIHEDPLFVNPDNNDFHLTTDSPCIDAGDPESPPDPDGTIADMGAFHYHQRDIDVDPDTLEFVGVQTGIIDTLSILIRNVGLTLLQIYSLSLDDEGSAFEIISETDTFSIEAESESVALITFSSEAQAEYRSTLWITSDDPDEDTVTVQLIGSALSVNEGNNLPLSFAITNVYPNPFNSATTIRYELPQPSQVSLSIFDISGRLVETLVDGRLEQGRYAETWRAEGLPSGVYFVKLSAGKKMQTRKVVLIR